MLLPLVLALACLPWGIVAQQKQYSGFIRVQSGRFVDATCTEFLFSGAPGRGLRSACGLSTACFPRFAGKTPRSLFLALLAHVLLCMPCRLEWWEPLPGRGCVRLHASAHGYNAKTSGGHKALN